MRFHGHLSEKSDFLALADVTKIFVKGTFDAKMIGKAFRPYVFFTGAYGKLVSPKNIMSLQGHLSEKFDFLGL